ncbi:MAG: NepR family anti-sigma factor [Pseudomonadota bacterium]
MSDSFDRDGSDDDVLQAVIGKHLREMYGSIVAEPVPDKIKDLLTRLEQIPVPDQNNTDDVSET